MAFSSAKLVFNFWLNLHFYIQPLVAWKRKQYLNSKEQKTDTQTLPRPSAQDSTRTWRKWRPRTLLSLGHNIPVRLRNVAAVNLPFLEVMIIDTLPFCRANIAKINKQLKTLRFVNTHEVHPCTISPAIFET